jgi:hypothetical protein
MRTKINQGAFNFVINQLVMAAQASNIATQEVEIGRITV